MEGYQVRIERHFNYHGGCVICETIRPGLKFSFECLELPNLPEVKGYWQK